MNHKLFLQDVLALEDLKSEGSVLLIRHRHENLSLMIKQGLVEEYQKFQSKPAFHKAKHLVVFLASEKNTAIFFGIFKISEILSGKDLPKYPEALERFVDKQNSSKDFYMITEKLDEFEKFKDRLVIDWHATRGFYNDYENVKQKELLKILPYNFVKDFPGLMNICLMYGELKKIIENPESHTEWYESLTRLQAVYLILDSKNGNQYVGTTYGKDGLWQRWETYVKGDGTGGNAKLIELKGRDPDFATGLQFSILEALSKTQNQKMCTEKESMWMKKLGTRSFGLN